MNMDGIRVGASMEEIRAAVSLRIAQRFQGWDALIGAQGNLITAGGYLTDANISGHSSMRSKTASSLALLTSTMFEGLRHDMELDIDQLGFLIARDVIAPVARKSTDPIAWLTSNNMMPPIRNIAECDIVRAWERGRAALL